MVQGLCADVFNVEAIIDLFNMVLKIAVGGGLVLMVTKFIKFRKSNGAKTEIQNLEARLSQLRMALRGKIKRKTNVFRASFKNGITEGDIVDVTLKDLNDIKFENSHDFQEYFDLSRRVVGYIQAEDGAPQNQAPLENDFMCSELKTEMEIVRCIKDMTDISAKANSRIEEYNKTNSPQLSKIDPLSFEALVDVNRIFRSETSESDTITRKAS